ncbi:MAG: AI-2E family transporter [Synechococcaceae cyanobacterium SM1_2_3]|nr:AI-2E family transporter [Synechococcaceae cyanobacterium SM1_2_3]
MNPVNPLPTLSEPVRTALRLLIIGSLLLAVFYILWPFLPSMLWSAFIVITVWPGLAWLQGRFGWSRAACALLLAVVLIGFVIGPLLTGIFALVEHGEAMFHDAKAAVERIPEDPPTWVGELPLVGSSIAQTWRDAADGDAGLRARLGPAVQASGQWLLGQVGAVGGLFLQFLLVVVFTLVFYLNGADLDDLTRRLTDRLGGDRALQARDQARQAIRAVALGVVLTAFIQAGLALIGLLIAGAPLATVIAFGCFLLAIAQLGAALPLLVVAGWLYWGQGEIGWAVFMAIWGLVVVGGVDNIVRPC